MIATIRILILLSLDDSSPERRPDGARIVPSGASLNVCRPASAFDTTTGEFHAVWARNGPNNLSMLATLEQMPSDRFNSPNAVSEAIGKIE